MEAEMYCLKRINKSVGVILTDIGNSQCQNGKLRCGVFDVLLRKAFPQKDIIFNPVLDK